VKIYSLNVTFSVNYVFIIHLIVVQFALLLGPNSRRTLQQANNK